MPIIAVKPSLVVATPDTTLEQDFELDIRVTTVADGVLSQLVDGGNPQPTWYCSVTCAGHASCDHSCNSIWYAWCC